MPKSKSKPADCTDQSVVGVIRTLGEFLDRLEHLEDEVKDIKTAMREKLGVSLE